jgi:hypothetical protein
MAAKSQNNGARKKSIATRRLGKRAPAATSKHATVEELVKAMFSMRSVPRTYNEDERENLVSGIKYSHGVPRDSEPRMTVVTRISSNLPDRHVI